MREPKLYQEIKKAIEPYLFFWNEWAENGNCNLDPHELELINTSLNDQTEPGAFNNLQDTDIIDRLERILLKLDLGYQVFKDFVIVNFLQTIIDLANSYGYESFLRSPIRQLNIDEDLKVCLLKLKAHTLLIAFIIYKAEDFNRRWLYEVIVEFQNVFKAKSHLSTPKTIVMK